MADFGSALWNKPASGGGGGDSTPADPVTRSLRFDPDSNSYLQRATGSTDTTWTMAMWVKRSGLTGYQYLFNFGSSKGLAFYTGTNSLYYYNGSTNTSTEVFRDPSAWFHLTMVTTSGTATFYVNGVQVTSNSFSTPRTSSALGTVTFGRWTTGAYDFDGYLADIHFVEGEAKSPTDFIESNGYGGYKPKAYTGSFGTNGFHIDAQPAHDAELLVTSVDRNDGDTDFVDVAAGHTITDTGDPKHSIKVGNPFTGDGRAIYFDGTDDYLTVDDGANIDLGTGDFTIEFWVNSHEDRQNMFIMGRWNATPNSGNYSSREFGITMSGYDSIGFVTYSPSFYADYGTCTTCDGKWHHIALVRSGGDAKGYVDGKYIFDATYLDSADMSFSSKMLIGAGQATYWEGAMYDFRISDTARYTSGTSDFDVPTEKFTSDSDTLLLIQPDKDDTTFHDESSSPATVTTVSAPTRKASTPYEAAAKSTAMYFDGSSDTLTTSTSTDLAIASGDSFTAECWVYISNLATDTHDGIFSGYLGSTNTGWAIETTNGYWGVYDSGGGRQTSSTAATTGEWHHLALVKTDSTTNGARLYLNGNKIHDVTISSNITSARPISLGAYYAAAGAYWMDGYIFDARFTKGEEKYTGSTYTVPSAPFELNPVYLGGDQSGNKNHLTPTNISGHDVVLDTPTRSYATWNPLTESGATYSEGNTKISCYFDSVNGRRATMEVSSGKWYWEVLRLDAYGNVGVFDCSNNTVSYYAGWTSSDYGVTMMTSGFRRRGSTTSTSNTTTTNDIVQFALDVDAGKLWIGKNGTWFESGDPSAGTNAIYDSDISGRTWSPTVGQNYSATSNFVLNAGADPTFAGNKTSGQDTSQNEFYYAPPTGFSGL